MASIIMKRGTSSEISSTPISDGQILFETDTKNIYIDEGSNRIEYRATTIDIDAELSTTSENPVQNKVITTNMNDLEERVENGFDELSVDLNELNSNLTWKTTTLTSNPSFGSFSGEYNAWYRYNSTFIEIVIRGTYVTKTTLPEGQPMCRVLGLPIAIPHSSSTMVWDDTAQVWRRFTIETDGCIKLSSNASVPNNSWLSNETTNFIIYR